MRYQAISDMETCVTSRGDMPCMEATLYVDMSLLAWDGGPVATFINLHRELFLYFS